MHRMVLYIETKKDSFKNVLGLSANEAEAGINESGKKQG